MKEQKSWYYVRMGQFCGGVSTLSGKIYDAPPVWARFIGNTFTAFQAHVDRTNGVIKVIDQQKEEGA